MTGKVAILPAWDRTERAIIEAIEGARDEYRAACWEFLGACFNGAPKHRICDLADAMFLARKRIPAR